MHRRPSNSSVRGSQLGVSAGAASPANRAVVGWNAAVRRHAINLRPTRSNGIERFEPFERLSGGGRQPIRALSEKYQVADLHRLLLFVEQLLRLAVVGRGRVLVNAMHGNARHVGVHRLGQLRAEQVVCCITDRTPVDRAENITLAAVVQHYALGLKRLVDRHKRLRTKPFTQRDGYVRLERGHSQDRQTTICGG